MPIVDRELLNQIAQGVWNEKKFSQTLSSNGAKEYALSEKQHQLISRAYDQFESAYSLILDAYQKQGSVEFVKILYDYWTRDAGIKRFVNIMNPKGQGNQEANGFFNGLFALYHAYIDKANDDAKQKKAKFLESTKIIVDLWGADLKQAMFFYTRFVVRIAIRYQAAIELLEVHDEGIARFADYIALMSIVKFQNILNHVLINQYEQENARLSFLLKKFCVEHDDKSESLRTVIPGWTFKINLLLAYSPMEKPTAKPVTVYYYSGEKKSQCAAFPHQLCTDDDSDQTNFAAKSLKGKLTRGASCLIKN